MSLATTCQRAGELFIATIFNVIYFCSIKAGFLTTTAMCLSIGSYPLIIRGSECSVSPALGSIVVVPIVVVVPIGDVMTRETKMSIIGRCFLGLDCGHI